MSQTPNNPPRIRLGELLVQAGVLSPEKLEEALKIQSTEGHRRRLGQVLTEQGFVDQTHLTQVLGRQLSVPWVSLYHVDFSRQLLNLVPPEIADSYNVIPVYVRHVRGQGDTLYVATDDPTNEEGLRRIAAFAGLPVRAMIAASSDIRSAIRAYYGIGDPPKAPSLRPETPAPKEAIAPPVDDSAPEVIELPAVEIPRLPSIESPLPDIVPSAPRQAPIIREIAQQEALASAAQTKESRLTTPIDDQTAIVTIRPSGDEPPAHKKKKRKAIALTFLDGTTITLPAPVRKERHPEADADPADDAGQGQLTAHDLTSALRALSQGADAGEVLGESPKWEPIVGALLSLLLRKRLVADWEFIEEYRRYLG